MLGKTIDPVIASLNKKNSRYWLQAEKRAYRLSDAACAALGVGAAAHGVHAGEVERRRGHAAVRAAAGAVQPRPQPASSSYRGRTSHPPGQVSAAAVVVNNGAWAAPCPTPPENQISSKSNIDAILYAPKRHVQPSPEISQSPLDIIMWSGQHAQKCNDCKS